MKKILFTLSIVLFLAGCSKDDDAVQNPPKIEITIPANGFVADKMQWFSVKPQVGSEIENTYKWFVNNKEVSTTADLSYVFATAGTYNIEFKAKNGVGESSKSFTVTVNDKAYLNRIKNVFDFFPAPGQFTNGLPQYEAGDTDETMRAKAEKAITTDNSMISLGGFGGYVTFGFDHTVINKEGSDFIVLGNAFSNWAEPGIIMVSIDANGNGKPDDEWFEIAGSEHNKATTIKNYELTYYKPATEPEDPSEPNYIRWTDNQGKTGYVSKNPFHSQPFYPSWKGNTITFKGTFLQSNAFDQSGTGSYWVCPAYDWGYADNWSNADDKAQINIDWAVNSKGESVKLKGIDFVKVYNSNRAEAGWLGEVSTEVAGFKDLNLP
ncbi:PKD family protein [Flavobacterium sp. 90]|uniref:PKD-like domain-containing protein n=1 Tax=unclassified Flavobacterium TaxID=196869 RepID=UPI000EAEE20D|nr:MULTISPECIES: PKD-like domain-containing protein [unclassified Flavobacterium]RKR05773.1 PKD family protein [Flavobacterium sp. 81]TCK57083.1 PKD family protein [Flavobacterium sp. 90]